jgi:serpin B
MAPKEPLLLRPRAADAALRRREFLLGVSALASLSAMRLPRASAGTLAPSDDVRALIDAYNASGRALFEDFVKGPGNIVFSPYSIGTAMAMALSGARGETEAEMAGVLKQRLTRRRMESANQEAFAILNGCVRTQADAAPCDTAQRQAKSRLLVANALMLTPPLGRLVSAEYVALAEQRYAAEVFREATLASINGWVSEKTEGKIAQIIASLPDESVAVLIDAIYFKAAWASAFRASDTRMRDFNLSSSATVKAPMMQKQARLAWLQRAGYRAIRLPFTETNFGLILVLPDAVEGLGEVVRAVDFAEQKALIAAFADQAEGLVALSLPKFKASFKVDLTNSFAGLRLARSDDADFSGMTGGPKGIRIGKIMHRAVIELAEEGVEAAAATAVLMRDRGISAGVQSPKPFVVDRPFLFLVVDNVTGAVLFQGRIVDPTQAA